MLSVEFQHLLIKGNGSVVEEILVNCVEELCMRLGEVLGQKDAQNTSVESTTPPPSPPERPYPFNQEKQYLVDTSITDWNFDRSRYFHGVAVYTDGSHKGVHSGSGIYIETRNPNLSVASWTSAAIYLGEKPAAFHSELMAIQLAVDHLLQTQVTNTQITFFADCKSVLDQLRDGTAKSKRLMKCHLSLNRLAESNNRIVLVWIPGHKGIVGNVVADQLAKAARLDYRLRREPIIPGATEGFFPNQAGRTVFEPFEFCRTVVDLAIEAPWQQMVLSS